MNTVARQTHEGFTLVELLIVMSLVAIVLGLGLGVFANLDVGGRVAVGSVQDVLRAAHNWSVARSAPARVVIDSRAGTLVAQGHQVVGTWHFEDDSFRGAFGIDGVRFGGEIVADGYQGRALSFAGEPPRSHVDFPVHLDPSWDLADGFSIRFALKPADERGGTLMNVGGAVGIETTGDGAIKAFFFAQRTDDETSKGRGGRVTIATQPHVLAPKRWSQVEVLYDRERFAIRVEGQTAVFVTESAPVARLEGPLVLSPSQNAFPGAIDALVVAVVVSDEPVQLPAGVALAADTPRAVVFQAGGGLDRDVHRETLRLVIEFDDGRKETVLVNLYGTVE
ncbi:MAG: prepilin-type N-terminal cleavage/methylation domain-containing protein [Planctomycetes bacterium]|nr:prepilin-type N-terminal cleavage/methylation domain-containing protein [Planctomycetota bacterium]